MIVRRVAICLLFALAPPGVWSAPLSVGDFSFEGPLGSDGATIEAVGENHFRITLGHAPTHPDWPNKLNFRILQNAKGNSLKLDVVFAGGPKYCFNEYHQSWSYDGIHWQPIEWPLGRFESPQKDSLHFPVFTEDAVHVGTQVPVSYEQIEAMIRDWEKNPNVSVHVIGQSLEGRNLYRVEVTDATSDVPRDRRWAHYYANQHPGEHNSQWRMVGMIEWLLSEEGAEFRRRSIHHFVLMMSPDAPSHGWYRTNKEGFDMNRTYRAEGSSEAGQTREAFLVQRDLEALMKSDAPPTTVWAMHTWGGNVDPLILPGPEMETLGGWERLRDAIDAHDTADDLVRPMHLSPVGENTTERWSGGPHAQFGVTAVLCEGGATLHTREKNKRSGVAIIRGLATFYTGARR